MFGISAFFNSYGDKILEIQLGERGVKSSYILKKLDTTIFKRFGNASFIVVLIYICLINTFILTTRKS